LIKELREKTSAGVMDCRNALLETEGDIDKAGELLLERGLAKALKKAGRVANQGVVESYIHGNGRIGVLLEINCETDFVAKTDEFKELAHNLALQIAAFSPWYICAEEIPEGKDMDPKVVCLLEQPYIKDESRTCQDVISETIAKVGERIVVRRFSRFELGK